MDQNQIIIVAVVVLAFFFLRFWIKAMWKLISFVFVIGVLLFLANHLGFFGAATQAQ